MGPSQEGPVDEQKLDLDQIRAVVQIASEADIAELEVASPTLKISVKKLGGTVRTSLAPAYPSAPSTSAGTIPAAAPGSIGAPGGVADHLLPITAPMVGTFYRAASPDAPPFVEEGDFVERGQPVCIIEAMKLFNEIQSEVRGRVMRVLAENASPVEYGQPLFLVDPTVARGGGVADAGASI